MSLEATWKFWVILLLIPSTEQQLHLQILSAKNGHSISPSCHSRHKNGLPFYEGKYGEKKSVKTIKKVNAQLWGAWSLECSCCTGFFSALSSKSFKKSVKTSINTSVLYWWALASMCKYCHMQNVTILGSQCEVRPWEFRWRPLTFFFDCLKM